MASPDRPRHIAIIMDGNGRWAQARGLPRIAGHDAGAESVRIAVRACREMDIEALTLYSFSTENWRRPAAEVTGLMGLLKRYVFQERRELLDNGIRLQAIGQLDRLPAFVRLPLHKLIRDTAHNQGMVLTLALSYGGRAEILQACQALAKQVKNGVLRADQITESILERHLQTAGLPDPDRLIRTSGEQRLSNFLLWQLAYAELYITEVPWPEFRRVHLEEALRVYSSRQRRFGKTGDQIGTRVQGGKG